MDSQQNKKTHKGGDIVRTEPYDMQLINSEPFFKEVFQRVGCLIFVKKMQRGHPEVAKRNLDMLAKMATRRSTRTKR
jgi:hypothetical protein